MNYRSLLGNFSVALVAQATGLLLGFVTSLIIPKVLSVTEYGYWQLFIFYAGYVGLFHFGLNDGVYLIHGGKTRNTIDKKSISSQFWFCVVIETIIASMISLIAIASSLESERVFILIATAIYLLFNNTTLFLGYLFQAMNETKLFSYSVAINNLVLLPIFGILAALNIHDFRIYISFYIGAKILSFLFCVIKGRELIFSDKYPFSKTIRKALQSINVGSKLLVANLASMLLIGALQFFIDFHWGIEVFSKLSLALSLVALFQVFAAQASMVLFPSLRQTHTEEKTSFFSIASIILGFFLPIVFSLYFPISIALNLWLPQYEESFKLFGLLLPICLFESRMDLIGVTYLKVLRKEGTLLKINGISSAVNAGCVIIAVFLFESIILAIVMVDIIIACRSLFTEHYIRKAIKAPVDNMALFTIMFSILFIVAHLLLPPIVTFFLSLATYLLFTIAQRKKLTTVKMLFKQTNSLRAAK